MLTEKQAWEFLADLWTKATDVYGCTKVIFDGAKVSGLCPCINVMCYHADQIDPAVKRSMYGKLCEYANSNNLSTGDWFWPTTPEGAKQRVEFCKTQGDLC